MIEVSLLGGSTLFGSDELGYLLPLVQHKFDGGHGPLHVIVTVLLEPRVRSLNSSDLLLLTQQHVSLLVQHVPELMQVIEALKAIVSSR